MNTKSLPYLRWLLLLSAGLSVGPCAWGTELPPARQPTELISHPNLANFGKFDGHGRLIFQELFQDGVPAGWHDTLVYYPRGRGDTVALLRDLVAINVFLAAEIRRPKTIQTFIKEDLTFFLQVNLGDDPVIITRREANEGLGSDPGGVDPRPSAAERARLTAKIKPYACSDDPVVKNGGWTVDVNVLTMRGAVEHWLVKGRVSPMRVDSFLCEPKEPNGTFHPNVRVR